MAEARRWGGVALLPGWLTCFVVVGEQMGLPSAERA